MPPGTRWRGSLATSSDLQSREQAAARNAVVIAIERRLLVVEDAVTTQPDGVLSGCQLLILQPREGPRRAAAGWVVVDLHRRRRDALLRLAVGDDQIIHRDARADVL